ncbi:MAG: hypothetical protein K0S37_800 [Microbacterium sp.]|nr:hypothetical protein [Microbacterium sp.]
MHRTATRPRLSIPPTFPAILPDRTPDPTPAPHAARFRPGALAPLPTFRTLSHRAA